MSDTFDGSTMFTIPSGLSLRSSTPRSLRLEEVEDNPELSRRIDLSIVIVNFNTGKFLKKCLKSVLISCKNLNCQVFVVDNTSSDGSERAATDFSKVTLIKNRENLGFAKANNIALRQAQGKYILLLNPDTEVKKNAFWQMLKFMEENPKVGAATCKVLLPSGEIDWASHRGFPTPWNALTYFLRLSKIFPKSRFFSGYHQTYKDLGEIHEIDSPSGAFYFVRRDVLGKVGLLDEDYFMYGEDLDWSWRIKAAGFKIYYNPAAVIVHHKGIASGIKEHSFRASKAELATRLKAAAAFYDTMKIFYRKHYQGKYPKFVKWLVFLGLDLLKNRRLAKLKVISS